MLLKNIFGKSSKKHNQSEEEIIQNARLALMGTGPYASMAMSDDWQDGERKMISDLNEFEEYAKKYSSPTLYVLSGKGWELFSIWYRRKNDDKTTPLKNAIALIEKALSMDKNNEEAKATLGEILIERVQVRDLKRGLKLLQEVRNKDSQIQGLITKAERWLGKLEIESEFDYVALPLIPLTVLREERAKCRSLIRSLKKKGSNADIGQVLDHMYRLAIIHDAATYVMLNTEHSFNDKETKKWDNKLRHLARNIQEYSYSVTGRITESHNCFLTENDYKTFIQVFGDSDNKVDPVSLLNTD